MPPTNLEVPPSRFRRHPPGSKKPTDHRRSARRRPRFRRVPKLAPPARAKRSKAHAPRPGNRKKFLFRRQRLVADFLCFPVELPAHHRHFHRCSRVPFVVRFGAVAAAATRPARCPTHPRPRSGTLGLLVPPLRGLHDGATNPGRISFSTQTASMRGNSKLRLKKARKN